MASSVLSRGESSTFDLLAMLCLMQCGTLLALFSPRACFWLILKLVFTRSLKSFSANLLFDVLVSGGFLPKVQDFALSFLQISAHHLPACLKEWISILLVMSSLKGSSFLEAKVCCPEIACSFPCFKYEDKLLRYGLSWISTGSNY